MRESYWYLINVCNTCDNRLNREDIYRNNGVCPKCGVNSNSSICNTKGIILKKISHHKWWNFWNKKYTYIAKDEISHKWLNNNLKVDE